MVLICDMVLLCHSPLPYMYVTWASHATAHWCICRLTLANKKLEPTYIQDVIVEVTDASGTEREYGSFTKV